MIYVGIMDLLIFELLFFGLCLPCFLVALWFTKEERKNMATASLVVSEKEIRD